MERSSAKQQSEQVHQYARRARMDVLADLYYRGSINDRIGLTVFGAPEEIKESSAVDKQAWLDTELARRIAQATSDWEVTDNDNEWRQNQQQISEWYQRGLLVLDLLTEDDMAEFIQTMQNDPVERMRHQAGTGDSMRVVQPSNEIGSKDIYSADFYTRAHP